MCGKVPNPKNGCSLSLSVHVLFCDALLHLQLSGEMRFGQDAVWSHYQWSCFPRAGVPGWEHCMGTYCTVKTILLYLWLPGEGRDPQRSLELPFVVWEELLLIYQVNSFKIGGVFVVFSLLC